MGMPRFSIGATGPLGAELSLSRGLGRDASRERTRAAARTQNGLFVTHVYFRVVATREVCACSMLAMRTHSIRYSFTLYVTGAALGSVICLGTVKKRWGPKHAIKRVGVGVERVVRCARRARMCR